MQWNYVYIIKQKRRTDCKSFLFFQVNHGETKEQGQLHDPETKWRFEEGRAIYSHVWRRSGGKAHPICSYASGRLNPHYDPGAHAKVETSFRLPHSSVWVRRHRETSLHTLDNPSSPRLWSNISPLMAQMLRQQLKRKTIVILFKVVCTEPDIL